MNTVQQKKPPHLPAQHLIFRSGKAFVSDPLNFLATNQKIHGDIYFFQAFHLKVGIVSKPEYVKHLLQDNNKNYEKSIDYKQVLKKFLGNGLLTSEGEFWRRQRRIAQPAFHKDRLAEFAGMMAHSALGMVNQWKNNPTYTQLFSLSDEMMSLTSEIVAKALFDRDVHLDSKAIGNSINRINELGTLRLQKPWYPPLWVPLPLNTAFKTNKKKLDNLIYETIDRRKKTENKGNDLLGMLLSAKDSETGQGMTDLQLRDELMTLFVAGHETSATTLAWTFYLLHHHPEAAKKLQKEIDTVLGKKIVTLEDLPNLPYTSQVIAESMRLYPAAYIIGRRSLEEDVIDGYAIDKMRNMLIPIYLIHRHPDIWEKPEDFMPERFEKEKAKNYDKFAYFPFGGGPRLCIGNNFALMEMQIILATFIQHFEYTMQNNEIVEPDPMITLKPRGGVWGRIKMRD